jgi:uncharacterized caspase-like protein
MLTDAHALVIGISRYVHAPALRTTQDAQDIAAALADPACCGYPPAAVHVLLDGDATRAAILDALDALAHATHESSTVFFYYSGHGAHAAGASNASNASYYLVPVDAAITSRDELDHTAISNAELTARLRAIPAGRLTVVLDCCRAAGMAELRLDEAVAPLAEGRGRVVLAASRDAAYSMPGDRDSTMPPSRSTSTRCSRPSSRRTTRSPSSTAAPRPRSPCRRRRTMPPTTRSCRTATATPTTAPG